MSSEWFYHVPQRKKGPNEPPPVPLMSQIPGLSDLPVEEQKEPHAVLIRDTDSNYIRLAKMGGRKNLLCYSQYKPSREPKKYPVPEWWGYKPTKPTDEEEFSRPRPKPAVPDYMVHQPYSVGESRTRSKTRIPFGQDGQSHWTRDEAAQNALKTSNIIIRKRRSLLDPIEPRIRNVNEEPMAGYVIRSRAQTAKEKPSNYFQAQMPQRMKSFVATHEEEPACLSKILNYGYQRDWLAERESQRKSDEERRKLYAANLKATLSGHGYDVIEAGEEQIEDITRYKSATKKDITSAASKRSVSEKRPWRTTSKTAHHAPLSAQDSTKNLFKMKQFRDVPSKVDVPAMEAVY